MEQLYDSPVDKAWDALTDPDKMRAWCFPQLNKTRLRLTHAGLPSFPDDPHFARERFEGGWRRILGVNLKQQLEAPG
jgi:uncharacterized protein YndB with AHSA1/START domain